MSFGTNISFYRARSGMTQEELADRLGVTRQTVSRWETDGAYPEMDKIVTLCSLFECDMETLVRGDAAAACSVQTKSSLNAYNRHMNIFTAIITSGVALILTGVALTVLLQSLGETFAVLLLLIMIAAAVALFVCGGILHANFMRDNPKAGVYPPERVNKFRAVFPFLISGGILLIFIGVIAVVALTSDGIGVPAGFTKERWENLSAGILLFCIDAGVSMLVAAGMQMGKYDGKDYNRECKEAGYAKESENVEPPEPRAKRISGAICSVIMLVAVIVFLLLGFLRNLWHPGWVAFPVGGVLCAISSIIADAVSKK